MSTLRGAITRAPPIGIVDRGAFGTESDKEEWFQFIKSQDWGSTIIKSAYFATYIEISYSDVFGNRAERRYQVVPDRGSRTHIWRISEEVWKEFIEYYAKLFHGTENHGAGIEIGKITKAADYDIPRIWGQECARNR